VRDDRLDPIVTVLVVADSASVSTSEWPREDVGAPRRITMPIENDPSESTQAAPPRLPPAKESTEHQLPSVIVSDLPGATPAPKATPDERTMSPTPRPITVETGPTPKPARERTLTPATGSSLSASGEVRPLDLQPGQRIGQYELIRELGSGGMGTVYLARDLRLGRRVAIKFLQAKDNDTTRRFILEARATATCSHENIVIIYEVGHYQGNPFMVLEFLQGQPLSQVAKAKMKLPSARAVELMIPVVKALACAHAQGIVHRDLKPDNVFVTESGSVKVLDFGVAKMLQGGDVDEAKSVPASIGLDTNSAKWEKTQANAVVGTLKYMSPEQWGVAPIDHRTDFWAVGIMLFQMLAGRHPLPPDAPPVITAMMEEPMTKLRDVAPEVPAGLAEVIDRCLMKKADDRYPDAAALLRALEPFQPGIIARELQGDVSPYAGLSSFQESDAGRFFGRAREIAAMVARIRDRPLMGVLGPSGVGKSSLVRAGLVPALKRSGEAWECCVLRPGRSPLSSLSTVLGPLLAAVTTDEEKDLAPRLRAEPGLLGRVVRRYARHRKTNVLLFVDQFEELYTLVADPAERTAFTTALAGVADDPASPTRVVISLRSDFLDRASEDPSFMSELSQGLFFVTQPGREGLRDALVQPAELAGYRYESTEIIDDMLNHLATTSSALPLLQFGASKLWDARDRNSKQLTVDSYRALGGIAGALASHADSVMAELTSQQRLVARAILLRLVTPERTRAIVTIDELTELSKDRDEVRRLVDNLVAARLLVIQTGDGGAGATVEIVHESLIHSWPALHRWLEETQEDSQFLEQLRNAAKQWQGKRDPGLLWRGEMVEEAGRFSRRYRGELSRVQREFLKAVFDLDARAARRRQAAAIGGGVFLAGLLVAAIVALVVIRDSQHRAERSAVIARSAETEAKQRLAEVQAKELARQKAEAATKVAEAETARAETKVEMTNEQLQKKNVQLLSALANAEKLRQKAEDEEGRAEISAQQALAAKKYTEVLLSREKERAQRLESQLGSPVLDELK
jgi:serine/threonine protein kinase